MPFYGARHAPGGFLLLQDEYEILKSCAALTRRTRIYLFMTLKAICLIHVTHHKDFTIYITTALKCI